MGWNLAAIKKLGLQETGVLSLESKVSSVFQMEGAGDIHVGIAEYRVASSPCRLLTLGLGSCVGVALYDPVIRLGGLAHVMLPDSKQFRSGGKPAKFADLGVALLVKEMQRVGSRNGRLVAKLAGGAQMFFGNGRAAQMAIGERNVDAVRKALGELGIRIAAEDVGGSVGRTITLDTSDGSLIIRMLGRPVRVI